MPTCQQRQKGAISVLAVAALGVAIVVAALAVDLGHVFWIKRDLQKAADLASLSALTDINNPNLINATAIAQSNALTNNADLTADKVTVFTGIYNWTTGTFAAGGAANQLNSVQVTVATNVAYFFRPGATPVTATAIAAKKEPTADFTADSFVASILREKLLASGNPVVDIPNLNILGLASATLQVIQPPVSAHGPAKRDSNGAWMTQANTAQVRLVLNAAVATVTVEAAKMYAALTNIDCVNHTATIQAQPQLLTVSVKPIILPAINVSSLSEAQDLTFEAPFDQSNTKTVPGTGLGGLLGGILGALRPIGSALDTALAGLGISLGGGDITVSNLTCYPPQLVY